MNAPFLLAQPKLKPNGASLRTSPLFRGGSWRGALTICFLALPIFAPAADPPPKAPVPPSPYLPVIYRYADAMLEHGRDTYGPQKTGLFLSALDRKTLAPLTIRPSPPAGVREEERAGPKDGPLSVANLQHDENLLRLLYTLSELSSKPVYREAADAALKWFLENGVSRATGLLPWGRHLAWDVLKDEATAKDDGALHQFFRPWVLWDRCFDLAAESSKRFAQGLWDQHVTNHETGELNAVAGFYKPVATQPGDFPRHAGFFIRTWACAYDRTKDEHFLRAIEAVLGRIENTRQANTQRDEPFPSNIEKESAARLSLAIDADGAAHRVPGALASRLRALAAREDDTFCALPHDLKGKGFVSSLTNTINDNSTELVSIVAFRDGGFPTARIGLMCLSRYENTGKKAYREMLIAAADSLLAWSPPADADTWPLAYGHAISLQVSAWRHTARPAHLNAARRLADVAVAKFFDSGPLPRASLKSDHYESITGADTLALALVELHLNILAITAVRSPPNTIDR